MPSIRRRKSKKARAADALGTYLKVATAKKAVKGTGKSIAAYQATKRTPLKWLPVAGAIGIAGALAARKRGGSTPATA